MPCLHEWHEEGADIKNEYFWQDLLVARWIFEDKPERHVDVGSRVDGFVAHVASFREIEVFDVRPIRAHVDGITFRQIDMMQPAATSLIEGYCDSLSCLHAIEHFGLGRYGDPIQPAGHEQGIANMSCLLKPGGLFYLSAPIGMERVEFNANRVFDPQTIIRCAETYDLSLKHITIVGTEGPVRKIGSAESNLSKLAKAPYNLVIFVFVKS